MPSADGGGPPTDARGDRRTKKDRRAATLLLAAAAVAATAVGAMATAVSSSASSSWQVSVRRQLDQAEHIRDGLDQVYAREAPEAVRVADARLQADELRSAGGTLGEPDRSAVLAQAAGDSAAADALAAAASPLAKDPRYATATGLDVGRRLADVRGRTSANPPDPAISWRSGDREAREGLLLVAGTIPIGVAFLLGALAQAYPAFGRRLVVIGGLCLLVAAAWTVGVQAAM